MPKSSTWLGVSGLERREGAYRSGSCNSTVSASSGDDDGLEHLSAEEKACLLFLEETIESLDNEEDGRLSDNESNHLCDLRKVVDELSCSFASASKLKDSQKIPSEAREKTDLKPSRNSVGPASVTATSNPPCPSPTATPVVTSGQTLHSRPLLTVSSQQSDHKHKKPAAPPAPLEAPLPPPTKPREFFVKTAKGPLPRGPLSYDALVHLRKSTSIKKTPLCPTVDHTIDSGNELPVALKGLKLGPGRLHSQAGAANCSPAAPPKPKIILPQPPMKSEVPILPDSSYSLKHAVDPEVVRLEALQKLGLLKEAEAERDVLGALPPPKSHSFLHPKPNRSARGASRSPSFCPSQVQPESRGKPLQSSASFHQLSRCEQQPNSVWRHFPTSKGAAAGLQPSNTQQTHKKGGVCPEARPFTDAGPVEATPPAPHRPQGTTNAVGYTTMVVPGMGADRKEALRKLGLLKNESR